LYGRSKKLRLEVKQVTYANLAYVQVSPRDVFIDFIQAPGLPRGEDVLVEIVRVFLTPPAAKSLAETLGRVVEQVRKSGKFERLPE
jgi:hypothetical protein